MPAGDGAASAPGSGLAWFGERCPSLSAFTSKLCCPGWGTHIGASGGGCDMSALSLEPWGQTHSCATTVLSWLEGLLGAAQGGTGNGRDTLHTPMAQGGVTLGTLPGGCLGLAALG